MKKGGLAGIDGASCWCLMRPSELKRIAAPRQAAGPPPARAALPRAARRARSAAAARADPRSPRARGCRRAAGAPARCRARSGARPRDRRQRQHPDPALERLVGELGADEPSQRGRGAADRDRALRGRRFEPLERPVHVAAHLLELVDRGRVGAQVGVGEEAGADPEDSDHSMRPSGSPIAISLEPPTSITATVPSTGRSSVRVAPTNDNLLLAGEHGQLDAARLLHRLDELVAVGCVADRGGGHGNDLLGADLRRPPPASHHLGGLGDLLSRDRASVAEAPADA